MDESYESLCVQLEKLRFENADLRMMLDIVRENYDLQSKLISTQRTNNETGSKGRKMTLQWQETLDEGRFSTDLPNVSLNTSTPLTIQSLEKGSSLRNTVQKELFMDTQLPQEGKDTTLALTSNDFLSVLTFSFPFNDDLQGQSGKFLQTQRSWSDWWERDCLQLERRILFHVFPRQTRLYGFTVLNIPEKILQVSKHPLTGRMDEDFRYDLSQRHLELMERLRMLGYSAAIHAPFAEYIVNTYGILKQRPDTYIAEEMGYNSPEFLRNIVIKTASSKLLKDLLCLLSCLCFMARQDRKPLFLW